MGNCQAAEAATLVIQRPGSGGWTVERVYWSVSAQEVMAANPGHYVAAVLSVAAGPDGVPVRHLKLLRPDDTLHIGRVYRLVNVQEVLKEFSGKKYVKLGKLLAMLNGGESGAPAKEKKTGSSMERRQRGGRQQGKEEPARRAESGGGGAGGGGGRQRQWRPALQSIAEVGS